MEEKEDHSKRPEDSSFKQQRLKAWQPLLTPFYVILAFVIIGVIFIPIGAVIFVASQNVVEVEVRYDNDANCFVPARTDAAAATFVQQTCQKQVIIPSDMSLPVYFYYKLTNFYQNHRRYVKSRSDTQLSGDSISDTSACDPLISEPGTADPSVQGIAMYPCGLIAASTFNDVFSVSIQPASNTTGPPGPANICTSNCWDQSSIAWQSDINAKFKLDVTFPVFNQSAPSTWISTSPAGAFSNFNSFSYPSVAARLPLPTVTDQALMVWMRTAGLPTFKKLYAKINAVGTALVGTDTSKIPAGSVLTVFITSRFEVGSFNGQKAFVLSTTSWMGGKNDFLGIAYIVVGCLCFLLAGVFAVKHAISPRQSGDMHFLSNWPGAAAGSTPAAAKS